MSFYSKQALKGVHRDHPPVLSISDTGIVKVKKQNDIFDEKQVSKKSPNFSFKIDSQ